MNFGTSANDAIADEIGKRAMMRELAGNFNMPINLKGFKDAQKQEKIYRKGMGTDNDFERKLFLDRSGPQLPRVDNMMGMDLAQGLPSVNGIPMQGPTQGPSTQVYYDKMMGIMAPRGGAGGLTPTPYRMM